ncbi:helix-turn-helix transcriptional regulator [Haladaptatus halobius]|uniref:helix-turn-helix transcriptional regulator n=1 Tax=Haladaptatus halobius TaxID=2884875 RepID=UPI001D0AB3A5|nr:hypothetical protein [Haladaptatus halobius]
MTPREYVNFLANSSTRHQILQEIAEQPTAPRTLASKCSCSRPTVHRALTKFQAYDWVDDLEDEYQITSVGSRILHQYDALLETLSIVMEYPQFFNQLGEEGMGIPLEAVESGTIVTATPKNPHAPHSHFAARLRNLPSEQCYVLVPIASPRFIEAGKPLLQSGTTLELVYDQSVIETASSEDATEMRAELENDQVSLYVCPDSFSFGLALFDEHVIVGTHDENGQFSACLESTNPELYTWATNKYTEYREAAHQIDPSEFS